MCVSPDETALWLREPALLRHSRRHRDPLPSLRQFPLHSRNEPHSTHVQPRWHKPRRHTNGTSWNGSPAESISACAPPETPSQTSYRAKTPPPISWFWGPPERAPAVGQPPAAATLSPGPSRTGFGAGQRLPPAQYNAPPKALAVRSLHSFPERPLGSNPLFLGCRRHISRLSILPRLPLSPKPTHQVHQSCRQLLHYNRGRGSGRWTAARMGGRWLAAFRMAAARRCLGASCAVCEPSV